MWNTSRRPGGRAGRAPAARRRQAPRRPEGGRDQRHQARTRAHSVPISDTTGVTGVTYWADGHGTGTAAAVSGVHRSPVEDDEVRSAKETLIARGLMPNGDPQPLWLPGEID